MQCNAIKLQPKFCNLYWFFLQESVLPIEYLEKQIAPELESCLEHDDWVSGIHVNEDFVLTGGCCKGFQIILC